MIKKASKKEGNGVIKTIVRDVVREEVGVVRKEMGTFKSEIRQDMNSLREDMGSFKSGMREDMGSFKSGMREDMGSFKWEIKEEIKEQFETYYAKYRDEVLARLDKAIGFLRKTDEEQTMHSGQHEDVNDRLDKLDALHPHGKHA